MNTTTLAYAAIISLSYLIGSIPFGLVLGKVFKVGDIRSIGSGNIGATNALRTGNKSFAICVLLGDGIKGTVAIFLARHFFGDIIPHAGLIAGFAAIIGHIFPVWLRFKGGKGVATGLGILAAWFWPVAVMCAVMWLVTAKLSRYSSLAAILTVLQAPIYAKATGGDAYALPIAVISVLILWTHRGNLARLMKGEESVIKLKK
jgi:glycerol-3-phosphate acyltransferase PlsY